MNQPIELINKTVYNGDTFVAFYKRVWETVGSYSPHPKYIRLTYYNPTPKDKLVDYSTKGAVASPWTHVRHHRPKGYSTWEWATFSIVRPSQFYSSPLEQLAQAGIDDLRIPRFIIKQMAEAIVAFDNEVDYRDYTPRLPSYHDWSWLDDVVIPYTERKRRATIEERMASLERKRNDAADKWSRAKDLHKKHTRLAEKAEEKEHRYWDQWQKLDTAYYKLKNKLERKTPKPAPETE